MSQQQTEKSSESFYQGTPRVDADIGPLTFLPQGGRCPTALTLPTDPALFMRKARVAKNFPTDNELPQNIVNEARANLQSHVSDFFQQISMATSPEDVMEAESVPFSMARPIYPRALNEEAGRKASEGTRMPYLPKLAKITRIHSRCRTPYHGKLAPSAAAKGKGHTPLLGKLSSLAIDQDLPKFENMDNTVTEVLNR